MTSSKNWGHTVTATVDVQTYELNLNPELICLVLLISGWNLSLHLKEDQRSATPDCGVGASSQRSVSKARHCRRRARWWSALHLLLLHQPPVVGQDFTLGQVERHLQGHQDGKLKGDQLPPADPETLLQLLQRGRSPDRQQKKKNRKEENIQATVGLTSG